MVAVLQAGLALPAYLVPHEVRSRPSEILLLWATRERGLQAPQFTDILSTAFRSTMGLHQGTKQGLKPVLLSIADGI